MLDEADEIWPVYPLRPWGAERVARAARRVRWGISVRPRTRRARLLRQNASDAERLLWRALREMNLPVKVRRQHPVGRHIADFAIPARKLAIELDGGQHGATIEADESRSRALNAHGYRVIRFWNNEVLGNLPGVLQVIATEVERAPTSP